MWILRRPAERFEMLFPVIAVLWMVPALAPPSKAPFPKSFEWFPSILFCDIALYALLDCLCCWLGTHYCLVPLLALGVTLEISHLSKCQIDVTEMKFHFHISHFL